jgi:hypothetical protein
MTARASTGSLDLAPLRLGFVAIAGLGLAGLAATAVAVGSDWGDVPISSIAADPAAAGPFRLTMLGVGVVGLWLAIRVGRLLEAVRLAGATSSGWTRLYQFAWLVAALGFLGVGLFPLRTAPLLTLAHGVAAYAIPIAVLTMMFLAPLAYEALRGRFGRASLAGLAAVLGLYVLAMAGLMPYAAMEIVAFAVCGLWLVVFVERLGDLAGIG